MCVVVASVRWVLMRLSRICFGIGTVPGSLHRFWSVNHKFSKWSYLLIVILPSMVSLPHSPTPLLVIWFRLLVSAPFPLKAITCRIFAIKMLYGQKENTQAIAGVSWLEIHSIDMKLLNRKFVFVSSYLLLFFVHFYNKVLWKCPFLKTKIKKCLSWSALLCSEFGFFFRS